MQELSLLMNGFVYLSQYGVLDVYFISLHVTSRTLNS